MKRCDEPCVVCGEPSTALICDECQALLMSHRRNTPPVEVNAEVATGVDAAA